MEKTGALCRTGKAIRLTVLFAVMSFCILFRVPADTYALPYDILPGGNVDTSALKSGTDYELKQDAVLNIDKSISLGRIWTNTYKLTIRGSEGTELTLSELKTSSSKTADDIVLMSGNVKVDSINGPNDSREAIYSSGHLRIDGGHLTVYASRSAPETSFLFGINVRSFEMNGGSLTIDVRTYEDASVDGLYIFGNQRSVVNGGTIDITSLKTGIGLGHDGSLIISGGYISAEGGLGTADGYGIHGSSGTNIQISGGQVFAKGGEHGILFPAVEICGTARVDTDGQQTCGISAGSFSIRDNAYLKAWGRKYAILTEQSKGGIFIGPQHYFVKPATAAVSTPAARQETNNSEYIATSLSEIWAPATEVVINHAGIGGTAPTDDPGKIKKSTVSSLPANTDLKAPDASRFFTDGNLSKKRMTVHFEKVEGATDYIIAWKKTTAKNWNYATCGNKDTFVIRGLKRGALLNLKIASYAYGRRGPWSKEGRFCFESVKASVSRKGKKVTVPFNQVKGAVGYQLLWADNPNMSGFKNKTVKNKTKLVLKNLEKSRKYYIRWRLYKIYKGKKYYGLCSRIKKI